MESIQLALFGRRVEAVVGSITSLSTKFSDLGHHGRRVTASRQVEPWRSHQPYIQTVAVESWSKKRRLEDSRRDSFSSNEGTDDAQTLVSDEVYQPYMQQRYRALPPIPKPIHVIGGKILPNIADYDFDPSDDEGSDNDTFYSYEGTASSPTVAKGSAVPVEREPSLQSAEAAKRELIEVVTRLSPPPLHHSGRARSMVVSIPRNSPGTCPIHGCADCGLCDSSKPFIFTI